MCIYYDKPLQPFIIVHDAGEYSMYIERANIIGVGEEIERILDANNFTFLDVDATLDFDSNDTGSKFIYSPFYIHRIHLNYYEDKKDDIGDVMDLFKSNLCYDMFMDLTT